MLQCKKSRVTHRRPAQHQKCAIPNAVEAGMLKGTRIVEMEALGPAPFAGMLFADLGADVIVVHRKQAPMPGAPERSLLDRGKRSIALDLKDAEDVAVLMRLIATADGLIEGFR